MPAMSLKDTRRVPRFSEQKWLLDAVIKTVGVEWDQDRLAYYAGACGQGSQGMFQGIGTLINTYNDISREFMKAARTRELRALANLEAGHEASARENFFTASILYLAAQWPIAANTALNMGLNDKRNACYDEFIKLAGRRIERVSIPFGDRLVPAYLSFPPGYNSGTLPCVVIVSGMDGAKEISVSMDGDKWLARGFAVLAVDGPGQGEAMCQEVWFDPDTYGQLGPSAYEFAAARPEIDPARIVVHGLSFGSYWATLLAAAEPRYAACGVAMTCYEPHGFSIFESASPTFKLRFMYMTGTNSEAELAAVLDRIDVQPLAASIKMPFAIAAGEDDQLSEQVHTFAFLNALSGPKTLFFYEGEDHGLHASRAGQLGPDAYTMVANWLMDRGAGVPASSTYVEVDGTGHVHTAPWGDSREYVYGLTENLKQVVFGETPLTAPSNLTRVHPAPKLLRAAE